MVLGSGAPGPISFGWARMASKELVGRVVSNRMQKTVLVAIDRLFWNSKYKTHEKRVSKIMAHDEAQDCDIGDIVKIQPLYRKLSKHKSHQVKEVVKKVDVYNPSLGARLAAEFDSRQRPTDHVADAKGAVEAAAVRLKMARELLEKHLGTAAAGKS